MTKLITRIAPSPSGDMHLGTARTALFNYLAAKASGGRFILRIDDTNPDKNREDYVKIIYDTLEWLGLKYDSTFRQSERAEDYHSSAQMLLRHGFATTLENGAIALKVPQNMPNVWEDELAGKIKISGKHLELIDGLILSRGGDKLGEATYQFSSVVDDRYCGVNHIIRGVDHIDNTPKQIAIWMCLDAIYGCSTTIPKFTHVGLITKDGKKLSKRDKAASMLSYRDSGYSPGAINNFLLRMGWGPRVDNKDTSIIPMDRAIKMFMTEGRMRSAPSAFDQAKLDWYNRSYKRAL